MRRHGEDIVGDVEELLGNFVADGVFLGDFDDEGAQFAHIDRAAKREFIDLALQPRNDEKLRRVQRQRDAGDQRLDEQHITNHDYGCADLQQWLRDRLAGECAELLDFRGQHRDHCPLVDALVGVVLPAFGFHHGIDAIVNRMTERMGNLRADTPAHAVHGVFQTVA